MTNERIEALPTTELDHFLSEFFTNTRRQSGEENELAAISNFQRRIVQNERKHRIDIESDENDCLFISCA